MPFNLIVTAPDGTEYGIDEHINTRGDAGMHAGFALAGLPTLPGNPPGVLIREVKEFADRVMAAPLGENVTHGPSGYRFRTEEA